MGWHLSRARGVGAKGHVETVEAPKTASGLGSCVVPLQAMLAYDVWVRQVAAGTDGPPAAAAVTIGY